MKDIEGLRVNHIDFQPVKMGDFLYYEGPLLSHFIDKNNPTDHYFFRWADFDDDCHRWLIFKSSEKDIVNFFNKTISLSQLITKNSTILLVDLDDELNKKQILITTTSKLPETYLPSVNSFYKEEQYHPYALELKNQFAKKESEQNMLIELLRKVHSLDEQQKKTYKLLNEVLYILNEQDSTSKTSKFSKNTNVYQDELLNSLINPSNNYAKSKSWQYNNG